MPKISIIIPTLNEEKYITGVLTDLSLQTIQPYEIIVVDGNSVDKTKKIVKQFAGVKLFQIKAQVAMQRDFGGKKARGDILYFLDADVHLSTDFIEKTVTIFQKRHLDLACPVYFAFNAKPIIQSIYFFFSSIFLLGEYIIPSGAGSCIIIKRSIYQKNKGFQKMYKFDDIELVRRLGKKYRFGMLRTPIYVSDRRFTKEGILKTFLTYVKLSFYFVTNNFSGSNQVKYVFGKFKN